MNKAFLATLLFLSACARGPLEVHSFQRQLMHTTWDFSVVGRDPKAAEAAVDAVAAEISRLDGSLAMWQPQSEVAQANASAGLPQGVTVSADLAEVLTIALQASKDSNGTFDPTVGPLTQAWYNARKDNKIVSPTQLTALRQLLGWQKVGWDPASKRLILPLKGMALDLGGIAKGYAQDRTAPIFRQRGFDNFLMNAGGQVYAAGQKPDGKHWRVGILDPRNTEKVAAVLELKDQVLATSGDYEQFSIVKGRRLHHILDPRTGEPVSNGVASASSLLSLSSSAHPATWADIDGKPVFIKGVKDGMAWLQAQGAEGVIISGDPTDAKNMRAVLSDGIRGHLKAVDTDIAFPKD